MDVLAVAKKVFDGILDAASKYLLFILAILIGTAIFVAGDVGLGLLIRAIEIAQGVLLFAKDVI